MNVEAKFICPADVAKIYGVSKRSVQMHAKRFADTKGKEGLRNYRRKGYRGRKGRILIRPEDAERYYAEEYICASELAEAE